MKLSIECIEFLEDLITKREGNSYGHRGGRSFTWTSPRTSTRLGGMHRTAWLALLLVMLALVLPTPAQGNGLNPIQNALKCESKLANLPDWQIQCLRDNGISSFEQDFADLFDNEIYKASKVFYTTNPTGIPKLSGVTLAKALIAKVCGQDAKAALAAATGGLTAKGLVYFLQLISLFLEGLVNVLTILKFVPKGGTFFGQIRARLDDFLDAFDDVQEDTQRACVELGNVRGFILLFLKAWDDVGFAFSVLDGIVFPGIVRDVCRGVNAQAQSLMEGSGTCSSLANYNASLRNRALQQTCSFAEVLDPPNEALQPVLQVSDASIQIIDETSALLDPLIAPAQEVADAVSGVVDQFDPMIEAFEPVMPFFESLRDAFQAVSCDICSSVADAVDAAVEAVLDAFLKPLGVDLGALTEQLLAKLGIVIPVIDFSPFDADFLTPVKQLTETANDTLNTLANQVDLEKFSVTEKLNEALSDCVGGGGAWPVRVATVYGDQALNVDCSSYVGTRPVLYSADYARGACSQDMTGFFRFPCEDLANKSMCTISNYPQFSRCPPDPNPYEPLPFFSSTVFHVTYYCIDQSEEPDVLAELLVVNLDAIKQGTGDKFPVTGLDSFKFSESPATTRAREFTCPGTSRIDFDARSSRRRKCLGSFYDDGDKYRQDLCYWDFFYFKENTDGTFGSTSAFGNIPTDAFKQWWTKRDAHAYYKRDLWKADFSIAAITDFPFIVCGLDSYQYTRTDSKCGVCPDVSKDCLEDDGGFCKGGAASSGDLLDQIEDSFTCAFGGTVTDTGYVNCFFAGNLDYVNDCPQSGDAFDTRNAEFQKRVSEYDNFVAEGLSCVSTWTDCNGAKTCNLVGCELDYFHWACVDLTSDVAGAEVVYHYADTVTTENGKTITCPTTPVQQQLIILKAEFGVGFDSQDATEELQSLCSTSSTSCTISAKVVAQRLGEVASKKTLRVESLCVCPAGYEILPTIDNSCEPCGEGKYREFSMPECVEVPAGYYSGNVGERDQKYPCAAGKYSDSTGFTECLMCPGGYWNDEQAAPTCKECGPGSASADQARTTSCDVCGAGLTPNADRRVCVHCPTGTAGPLGDGLCYDCVPGSYANTTGSTECIPTGEGQFQPQAGQGGYYIVGPGYFASSDSTRRFLATETGATKPQKCPEGFTTQGYGATSVNDCIEIVPPICPPKSSWNISSIDEENCKALVALLDINITEKGNGFCQICLNVKECDWDGGDCCIETCKEVVFDSDEDGVPDEILLSGSCNPRNMDCLNPDRNLADFNCTARLITPPTFEGNSSDCDPNDPSIGNGICDENLNVEECGYDGGDCCLFTCEPFVAPFCSREQMNCMDPLGSVDNESPRLKGLPPLEIAVCFITDVPSVPKVTASDNDPCFVTEPTYIQDKFMNDPFGGQTTSKRNWTIFDLAGNMDTFEQTIMYFEYDIRTWGTEAVAGFLDRGCGLPVQIIVEPTKAQGNDKVVFLKIDDVNDVAVAILGTEFLDITRVDKDSLSFNGLVPRRIGKGLKCKIEDMNRDDFDDLVCQFEDDTQKWGNIEDGNSLILAGNLLDRTPIVGEEKNVCVGTTPGEGNKVCIETQPDIHRFRKRADKSGWLF